MATAAQGDGRKETAERPQRPAAVGQLATAARETPAQGGARPRTYGWPHRSRAPERGVLCAHASTICRAIASDATKNSDVFQQSLPAIMTF